MSEFENKNIYSKDYFELYSQKRNKSFRFARYNKHNYKELCDFIHEISPNTVIWDEKRLRKGSFYTYSGRTFQFGEVPLWEMRCCIANNPFIIVNQKTIPLDLTQAEAEEYLQQSVGNRVTCYDNITTDYIYWGSNEFCVVNEDHPKGLSCAHLDAHNEWYIIIDDGLHVQGNSCVPKYEDETHTVHFTYNLRDKADRIIDLMYEINRLNYFQNHSVIFNPSWEDYSRYRKLYYQCMREGELKDFIQTLYNYIYEETKSYSQTEQVKKTRGTLPSETKYHEFVEEVGEFRNYYDHGVSEYITNKNFSMADLFLKYIQTNNPPCSPNEFEMIQLKMLNGFIDFLLELKSIIASKRTIRDYLQVDERGNVFVSNILLPRELRDCQGCLCEVSNVIENNLTPLNNYYEYYCQFPNYICKQINGDIGLDSNDNVICGNVLLGEFFRAYLGQSITIEKQGLTSKSNREKGYLMIAKEGKVNISPREVGAVFIKNGKPYLFDYVLPLKWLEYDGYMAALSGISFITEGTIIKSKMDLCVVEGIMDQDNNNNFHCGNVLVPLALGKEFLFKRVKFKLERIVPNKNQHSRYPYFCANIDIAN